MLYAGKNNFKINVDKRKTCDKFSFYEGQILFKNKQAPTGAEVSLPYPGMVFIFSPAGCFFMGVKDVW
ncbi:MAG: hypothetical protein WC364_11980 [Eubacteriales bacterium]|jgi:hypothetical protein